MSTTIKIENSEGLPGVLLSIAQLMIIYATANLIVMFFNASGMVLLTNITTSMIVIVLMILNGKNVSLSHIFYMVLDPSIGMIYLATANSISLENKGLLDQLPMLRNPAIMQFVTPFLRFELKYVSPSSARNTCHIQYDDSVLADMLDTIANEITSDVQLVLWALIGFFVFLISAFMVNLPMMLSAFVLFGIIRPIPDPPEEWGSVLDTEKFHGRDGIYEVTQEFFGSVRRVGVAYAENGIIQTRYHVTGLSNVHYDGITYKPSHHNKHADMIAWGGALTYVTPKDGEKIMVEILPVDSTATITYETVARTIPTGEVVFKGLKALPGTSGSPYFVVTETETEDGPLEEISFAGCVGRNMTTEYDKCSPSSFQVEVLAKARNVRMATHLQIEPGSVLQHFDHPGSGKTYTIIPSAIRTGLAFCQNVIVAGPTRVVARELYASLRKANLNVPITLHIKGATMEEKTRFPRVIITTHPSLLTMMVKGDSRITTRTGFIIDETHFHNSKTLFLLSDLRNRFRYQHTGFLLETTATGFSLTDNAYMIKDASNYEITNHTFNSATAFKYACSDIIAKHLTSRIIIFCPSVTGEDGVHQVVKYLTALYPNVVSLHRRNYESRAPRIMANYDDPIIIVTTSISECGANFNVDVCIDSCRQMRYTREDEASLVFTNSMGYITQTQYVQRRGRVGRRRPGDYYYPSNINIDNLDISMSNNEAEVFDLMVYNKHREFENMSEYPTTSEPIVLSPSQFTKWVLSHEDGSLNNPYFVSIFYSKTGIRHTETTVINSLKALMSDRGKPVKVRHKTMVGNKSIPKEQVFHFIAWDDRDAKKLISILSRINTNIGTAEDSDDEPRMATTFIKTVKYKLAKGFDDMKPTGLMEGHRLIYHPRPPDKMTVAAGFLKEKQTYAFDTDFLNNDGSEDEH